MTRRQIVGCGMIGFPRKIRLKISHLFKLLFTIENKKKEKKDRQKQMPEYISLNFSRKIKISIENGILDYKHTHLINKGFDI